MTTICRARMFVGSVELTILLGARSRRPDGVNVCRLTSENRGAKLENDSDKKDRAENPDPLPSVLSPSSYAFKQ